MDKISVVLTYIDEHYHEEINHKQVEKLTGCSFRNFSEEFQKETGQPFLRYLIRRQLTLIKEEICNSGFSKDISFCPFNDRNEFSNLFKYEFKLTLETAIKNEHIVLQERYGSNEWEKCDLVVQGLLDRFGSSTNALKFLLSLRPYFLEGVPVYLYLNKDEVIDLIIRQTYGDVPPMKYSEFIYELETFYMLERDYYIKHKLDFLIDYALVKRGLIYKLMLEHEGDLDYSVSELKTLWSISNDEKLLLNRRNMQLSHSVIKAISDQDLGVTNFENIDELRCSIHVNYSKPRDNPKYQHLDEGKYPYILMEEKYELLEIDDLRREINELLAKGLLYLKRNR